MVQKGTRGQEKNPPELLLKGCVDRGCHETGFKQNHKDEFRVGNIPSNTALKAVLPLEGVVWAARGRGGECSYDGIVFPASGD